MSKIIKLDDSNFDVEVLGSSLPVLVDFWAEWCAPCKMMGVILEEISNDYDSRLKICKVNVEDGSSIPSRFNISNIPTLKLFKDGKVVATHIGNNGKAKLVEFIDGNI